jgi:quinol monooxygenase YgiN
MSTDPGTTSKVTMIGTITCHDGKADDLEEVFVRMVEAAEGEPGVEVYSYHRGEENTFWFFALMADETAMTEHGQSAAMQEAVQAAMPLMAGPPAISMAAPVAGIGLGR